MSPAHVSYRSVVEEVNKDWSFVDCSRAGITAGEAANKSCGSCGYPLNLTSSNRITSDIGSEYKKSVKKGSISFASVDLSRFTQVDKINCFPISFCGYHSKTKLLCRKCGILIGYGYVDTPALCGFDSPSSSSSHRKFTVKIRALQPYSEES